VLALAVLGSALESCRKATPPVPAESAQALVQSDRDGTTRAPRPPPTRRTWDETAGLPTCEPRSRPTPTVAVPGLDGLAHRPLFALDVVDPWTIDSNEIPSFALYEDGLVLFLDGGVLQEGYVPPWQAAAFADDVAGHGFADLLDQYDCSTGTDQPVVTISARSQGRWRVSSAEGVRLERAPGQVPPTAWVFALREALAMRPEGALPWEPDVEVRLRDSLHAHHPPQDDIPHVAVPNAPPWPTDVPRPPPGFRVPASEAYAYTVDGAFAASLYSFLEGHSEAVVDGRVLSVRMRRLAPAAGYLRRVWSCARGHGCDALPEDPSGTSHNAH
jgi:hypothetical protein